MSNFLSTLLATGITVAATWCIYSFQKSDAGKTYILEKDDANTLAKEQNTEALKRVSFLLDGQLTNEIYVQRLFGQIGLIQESQRELADGVAKLRSVTLPIFTGVPSKEQLENAKWECHQYTGTAASMHASIHRLRLLISGYESDFDNAAKPLLDTFSKPDTGAVRQLNDYIEELSELKADEIASERNQAIRTGEGKRLLDQLDKAMIKVRTELDLISKAILSSDSKTKSTTGEKIKSIDD